MDLKYISHKYRKTQFNWGSAIEQGLATFSVSPGWLGPTLQPEEEMEFANPREDLIPASHGGHPRRPPIDEVGAH